MEIIDAGNTDAIMLCERNPTSTRRQLSDTAYNLNCLFWNVEYLKSVVRKAPEIELFDHADIVLLCETMCSEEVAATILPRYYVMGVDAGLEDSRGLMIGSKQRCIRHSKSKNHVAVEYPELNLVAIVFYFNPGDAVPDVVLQVANTVAALKSEMSVLIAGDFNCRIDQGTRGRDLCNEMNDMGFSIVPNMEKTYIGHNGGSAIDLLFIRKGTRNAITVDSLQVYHTELRKHGQLRFSLQVLPHEQPKVRAKNVPRQLNDACLEHLRGSTRLNEKLRSGNIDELTRCITTGLKNALVQKRKRFYKPWFDTDCRRLKRDLIALRSRNVVCELWNIKKREYKTLCTERRRIFEGKELDKKLEALNREPWKITQRNDKGKATQIDTAKLVRHFGKEKNPGPMPIQTPNLIANLDSDTWFNRPFSALTVYRSMHRASSRKATGPDYIANEHLKQSKDYLLQAWTRLFNLCLEQRKIPKDWENSFLKVIYKGKGDPQDANSYRGISLLCAPYKILTQLINDRIINNVGHLLPETQFGFRRGRSTRTPLENLLRRGQEAKENGGLFVLFVDFKSAFPSVPRNKLLTKLKDQFNIDGHILGLISDTLKGSTYQIDDGVSLTDPLPETCGVPQGDSLSPTLFLCYVSDLAHDLSVIDGLKHAFFADDLETDSENPQTIQLSLTAIETWCDANEISVNLRKTKVMKIRNGGRIPNNTKFYYKGELVEIVNEYEYLGVTIQPTLVFTKHIQKKIMKCYNVIGSMTNLSRLSIDTAMKVFNIKIRPIIEYGLKEISPFLKVRNLNDIDKIKATYLKRVLAVHKSTRNTLTLMMASEDSLTEDLQRKLDLVDAVWTNYKELRAQKIDKTVERGYLMGPAFVNDRWKKANQTDRHCHTRLTAHGFHHKLCQQTNFHEISPGCCCKLCDAEDIDLYHVLSCVGVEGRNLVDIVRFLD